VKYVAFYTGNEIRPLVPKILDEPPDPVILERGKYHGRLGEVVNEILARNEKGTLPPGWDLSPGRHLKVFLLSAPDAVETIKLAEPIINDLTSTARNEQTGASKKEFFFTKTHIPGVGNRKDTPYPRFLTLRQASLGKEEAM
jgi:hypothetical protein